MTPSLEFIVVFRGAGSSSLPPREELASVELESVTFHKTYCPEAHEDPRPRVRWLSGSDGLPEMWGLLGFL